MKRKYGTSSDKRTKKYECTKKTCKWQGILEEQKLKKVDEIESNYVCPKCGNKEFYNL